MTDAAGAATHSGVGGGGRRSRVAAGVLVCAVLACVVGMAWLAAGPSVPGYATVRARYQPSEAYLVDRNGELLDSLRVNRTVRRLEWVSLDAVSPALQSAILAAEDRRYYTHGPVDWHAVGAAVADRVLHGRRRGASTVTMQLASALNGERRGSSVLQNASYKFQQLRTARRLEQSWSKAQIFEAYLNLASFRGDLQGIGAAAQVLAGKSPAGLTREESLTLAALLPDPNAAAERVVLRACARARAAAPTQEGAGTLPDCASTRATTLRLLQRAERAAAAPSLAPQLARALLKRAGERVQTTLDAALQKEASAVLEHQLSLLADHNVRDGAVVVVDNRSGEVLAYVGSGGTRSTAGQVDGVRARRQAGSTLKPFLYELSLEHRYLTAASLLEDSPLNLDTGTGIYIPQDYDHEFKGLVSVRTALGNSLNVPAVRTLVLVGVEAFRDRLHALGYAGITRSGEYYGYSLALGSAEVSLWEQAQAYRALARGGEWSALRARASESGRGDGGERTEAHRVMDAAPSFVVSDILSDHIARSITFGLDNHLNTPFWSAAKTGTSKDMRDNWCIGFSADYTVGVWVGNFEGDAMHDVSGVTGAAPIWHDIMLALHQHPPVREAGMSGAAPEPPAGVKSADIRFTPAIEPGRREWFLDGTAARSIIAVARADRTARIVTPVNGMIIAMDPDIPRSAQIVPITAQGVAPGMTIKLNDTSLGPAGGTLLWAPRSGVQRLDLVDATGRSVDRVVFTVR